MLLAFFRQCHFANVCLFTDRHQRHRCYDRWGVKQVYRKTQGPISPTVKSSLMQKLRDRLRTPNSDTQGPSIGNKHAAKVTRQVEMAWLHFESGIYHQVITRKGGGTRNVSVQRSVTMGELLETSKGLFFPNGQSSKGPMKDFEFDICDLQSQFCAPWSHGGPAVRTD